MESKAIADKLESIGDSIRRIRLGRNLSQSVVAERSAVSLKALRNIESGAGASMRSFVAVCRTLGRTEWIDALAPVTEVSPVDLFRRQKKPPRQRAGKRRST